MVKNERSNDLLIISILSFIERAKLKLLTGRLICRSSLKFGLRRHWGHVYLACE